MASPDVRLVTGTAKGAPSGAEVLAVRTEPGEDGVRDGGSRVAHGPSITGSGESHRRQSGPRVAPNALDRDNGHFLRPSTG